MGNNIPIIQWAEKTIHLSQIRPLERNPRKISEAQFAKLKASLMSLGQFKPLLVMHDLRLAGGHQRLRIMRELGWETCRVTVPDVEISEAVYRDLIIRDNVNNGQWDFDILADEWDLEDLRGIGVHEVMDIAPFGKEEDGEKPKGVEVKCPGCGNCFPVKGNKV